MNIMQQMMNGAGGGFGGGFGNFGGAGGFGPGEELWYETNLNTTEAL
jgi:hypothetical protein